jgi:hypothetical protein
VLIVQKSKEKHGGHWTNSTASQSFQASSICLSLACHFQFGSSSKPCAPNAIAGNADAAARGATRRPGADVAKIFTQNHTVSMNYDNDELWWNMMTYDEIWWNMMNYDGLWWFRADVPFQFGELSIDPWDLSHHETGKRSSMVEPETSLRCKVSKSKNVAPS